MDIRTSIEPLTSLDSSSHLTSADSPMSYFRPEIEQMQGYVPGEQPQGGQVHQAQHQRESLSAFAGRRAGRSPRCSSAGLPRYPDPMADAFRRRAAEVLGVEPDWILCGNGSDDILTIVTRALVGQGELAAAALPELHPLQDAGPVAGRRRRRESRSTPTGRLPDSICRSGARICSWPSCRIPTAHRARCFRPSGFWSWPSDCPARSWSMRLMPILPIEIACAWLTQNDKIMVSRTLSKSYSLAGLRFGFIVAQPHVIEQLVKVKDSYNCDALAIAGATAAIDDQAWLAENGRKIIATRQRLTAGNARTWVCHASIRRLTSYGARTRTCRSSRSTSSSRSSACWCGTWIIRAGATACGFRVGTDEQIDACWRC